MAVEANTEMTTKRNTVKNVVLSTQLNALFHDISLAVYQSYDRQILSYTESPSLSASKKDGIRMDIASFAIEMLNVCACVYLLERIKY